jgi:hemerythrin superfamily protein
MNAIQMLREDHKRVQELFREFEMLSASQSKKKKTMAERILSELEVHTALEEEVFYPAFKEEADNEGQLTVEKSLEDHRIVSALIEELRAMDTDHDEFDARFEELIESVENHIEEEEDIMFPEAEDILGGSLERLGREMEEQREVVSLH